MRSLRVALQNRRVRSSNIYARFLLGILFSSSPKFIRYFRLFFRKLTSNTIHQTQTQTRKDLRRKEPFLKAFLARYTITISSEGERIINPNPISNFSRIKKKYNIFLQVPTYLHNKPISCVCIIDCEPNVLGSLLSSSLKK